MAGAGGESHWGAPRWPGLLATRHPEWQRKRGMPPRPRAGSCAPASAPHAPPAKDLRSAAAPVVGDCLARSSPHLLFFINNQGRSTMDRTRTKSGEACRRPYGILARIGGFRRTAFRRDFNRPFPLHTHFDAGIDDVADLQIVEIIDRQAALEAGGDIACIVF